MTGTITNAPAIPPALQIEGDTYTSPPASPGLLARLFPSLVFYPGLFGIIWHAAQISQKGTYTGEDWSYGSLSVLHLLEKVGVHIHADGINNVKALQGPCVFVANHMSSLETFVLPRFIQPWRDASFVVKKSLTEYPVFKHVVLARDPIALGRTNPREDLARVLEGGEERLKHGRSVIVFPQSTRALELDPAKFNSIGVKLARRAGVPVVPVALRTDAWGIGKRIKDFGPVTPALPVHFRFGAPITVEGNGKDAHAQVCSFIQKALAEWGIGKA